MTFGKFLFGLVIVCFLLVTVEATHGAQGGVLTFSDRQAFTSAANKLTVIDFEGSAPPSGFINYKAPNAFSIHGLQFTLGGGGKFGPGVFEIAGLLGKDETIDRIKKCLAALS